MEPLVEINPCWRLMQSNTLKNHACFILSIDLSRRPFIKGSIVHC